MTLMSKSDRTFAQMIKYLSIFLLLLLVSSCYKDDYEPDFGAVPENNAVYVDGIRMGDSYADQVYFDMSTQQMHYSKIADWDLAFYAQHDQRAHVRLNTGYGWTAAEAKSTEWDQVVDLSGISLADFKIDDPGGDLSMMALGDFSTSAPHTKIYILRKDLFNGQFDYFKIQVANNQVGNYGIAFSLLGDTLPDYYKFQFTVDSHRQVPQYHYVQIQNGVNDSVQNLEDAELDWDICFTRYARFFPVDNINYIVTGVLSRVGTLAYLDSTVDFQDITRDNIDESRFSARWDAIGFDWKILNANRTDYTVKDYYNYIIRTRSGVYYKLHFLGFYDNQGNKGNPKFEYEKLE